MNLNPTKQQAWLTMKLLGVYLPEFSQCLAYRHIPNSYMEAGFLNSGPYACTGNTFSTDPAICLSSLPSTLNLHFPQMFFNYCSYVQKPQLWFHMSLNISGLFCYIYKTWTPYLAGINGLFFEIRKSIYLFSLKLFSYGLKNANKTKWTVLLASFTEFQHFQQFSNLIY